MQNVLMNIIIEKNENLVVILSYTIVCQTVSPLFSNFHVNMLTMAPSCGYLSNS